MPFFLPRRAGEGAFLVAEQLALQQGLSDGGAVDGHERPVRAGTVAMDGMRHQLFSRPTFSLNEDSGIGGRDPANEVEYLTHGGTAADHIVFEIDFSAQLLIFPLQLFPVPHVVKGQAGDARHCGHDLQVIFVELRGWAGAVQIDGAQDFFPDHQGNAEQGAHFQLRQGLDLAQGLVAQDIAYQQTDALSQNTLHHGAADPHGMAGPPHPVPGGGRGELFRLIAEQDRAALGRDHVEDEAQKLPLQRVLIANAANPGGNLQQGIQVARAAGAWRQIGHDLVGLQVERVFRPQQKRRALEARGLQKFNRILAEVLSIFLEQEDEDGIADIDLVAMSYLLLLHRHSVDQRAIAAF